MPRLSWLFNAPDRWLRAVDAIVAVASLDAAWAARSSPGWFSVWVATSCLSALLFATNGTAKLNRWLKVRAGIWLVAFSIRSSTSR
ncbi:MAG: hypothetical protein PHI71_01535 [Acidiphilium sp.]|nr:hypothetical protein [Acidiphilium sp.]